MENWGHLVQKNNNNNIYWYPKDEDIFKKEIFDSNGLTVRIVGNNIDGYGNRKVNVILKGNPRLFIKNVKIEKYNMDVKDFHDCNIYAVAMSNSEMLKKI